MTGRSSLLTGLPNLGATIAGRLDEIGIRSRDDLARVGPARAYLRLCQRARRLLPVCYYLYSLEAALRGTHWTRLSRAAKGRLLAEVGQSAPRARRRRA